MAEHPIELPLTLIEQWRSEPEIVKVEQIGLRPTLISMSEKRFQELMNKAAQWGADTELEACEKWLSARTGFMDAHDLHSARRPKPPSLKRQALETLKYPKDLWSESEVDTIRRALKALPDD